MGAAEPVGQSGQESSTSETRKSGRDRSSARSGTALGGARQPLLCRREAAAAVDAYAVGLDVALVANAGPKVCDTRKAFPEGTALPPAQTLLPPRCSSR